MPLPWSLVSPLNTLTFGESTRRRRRWPERPPLAPRSSTALMVSPRKRDWRALKEHGRWPHTRKEPLVQLSRSREFPRDGRDRSGDQPARATTESGSPGQLDEKEPPATGPPLKTLRASANTACSRAAAAVSRGVRGREFDRRRGRAGCAAGHPPARQVPGLAQRELTPLPAGPRPRAKGGSPPSRQVPGLAQRGFTPSRQVPGLAQRGFTPIPASPRPGAAGSPFSTGLRHRTREFVPQPTPSA
jgi:hypothetical protein